MIFKKRRTDMKMNSKAIVIGIGVVVIGYLAKKVYDKYVKKEEPKEEDFEEVDEEFKRTTKGENKDSSFRKDDRPGRDETDALEDEDPGLEDYLKEKAKRENRTPKIITTDEVDALPAYVDQQVLYYYTYDYQFVDDEDNEINDPERLIGSALDDYGFYDRDDRIIFVMNYSLDTCYEVQKVIGSWSATQ